MKRKIVFIVLFANLFLNAADGDLDTSFGTNGIVTTTISGTDIIYGAALQPDGKIVAVGLAGGNFGIVRYTSNGSLDSTFGTNGIVTTDLGGSDQAYAAVLQPDGKIVAIGTANNDFALARYLIPSITISDRARDLRAKYDLIQKTSQ